jgi:O-antigen/teichoic acid export membrane protein
MTSNPTLEAARRYRIALFIALAAYAIVLFATIALIKRFEPPVPVRVLALLAPLVPVGFMASVFLRYLRQTDEFERRVVTDSLAVAAGITAMLSITYGFLEVAGLPHPSAWWTWMVLMGSWGVARCFVAGRYR